MLHVDCPDDNNSSSVVLTYKPPPIKAIGLLFVKDIDNKPTKASRSEAGDKHMDIQSAASVTVRNLHATRGGASRKGEGDGRIR